MAKQKHHSSNWGGKRKGAGRPGYTAKPTTAVLVRLPNELADELEREAQREGKSKSHFLFELVEKGLKARRRTAAQKGRKKQTVKAQSKRRR